MSQPNAPAYKKTNIAVFLAGTAESPRYTIIDARSSKQTSASVKAKIGDTNISPEDAYQLYLGNDIEVEAMGTKGPYTLFLVNAGISEVPKEKDGKTYLNRYQEIGIVNPVQKDGKLFGYNLRHPEAKGREDKRKVFTFANIGPKTNPIELDPGHAYKLVRGEAVQIPGRGVVTLGKIEESHREKDGQKYTDFTAKLNIEWAERQGANLDIGAFPDTSDEEEAALAT